MTALYSFTKEERIKTPTSNRRETGLNLCQDLNILLENPAYTLPKMPEHLRTSQQLPNIYWDDFEEKP
jgi:hypothetical protein